MYIANLWRRQPGEHFLVSLKSINGRWRDCFVEREDLGHLSFFFSRSKYENNIYACPHGFSQPIKDKKYAVLPKLLWADLDRVDPRELELRPTIAFQSSPGRFVGLWRTDQPVTEDLNRRLTYHVGADKSGWDLTQVLRIMPGTFNWKYKDTPMVKLLWDDGPKYRVRDLERKLPKLAATGGARPKRRTPPPDVTRAEGLKIARKHSLGMMYLGPCGNRSDVVFKIVRKLAENGATPEDAFAVVMASRAADRFGGDRRRAWRDVMRCWQKA